MRETVERSPTTVNRPVSSRAGRAWGSRLPAPRMRHPASRALRVCRYNFFKRRESVLQLVVTIKSLNITFQALSETFLGVFVVPFPLLFIFAVIRLFLSKLNLIFK